VLGRPVEGWPRARSVSTGTRNEMTGEAPGGAADLRSAPMPGSRHRHHAGALAATVAAVLAGLASCGGGSDDDSASTGAGGDRGAELYAEACASCHGDDLRGTERGPSHLSQVYEPGHHPDEAFRAAVAQGSPQHHWDFGDMPPVPGLDDDQVDAIIAYVRAVQQREGFEPYPG
jgi:mono/diheme cytochrome c family protein